MLVYLGKHLLLQSPLQTTFSKEKAFHLVMQLFGTYTVCVFQRNPSSSTKHRVFWSCHVFRSVSSFSVGLQRGNPSAGANARHVSGVRCCVVCTPAPGLFWKPSPPLLPLALIPFPSPWCIFTTPQGPAYLAIRTASHQAAMHSNHVRGIPSESVLPLSTPRSHFSPPEYLLFHTSLENCVISRRCDQAHHGNVCSGTLPSSQRHYNGKSCLIKRNGAFLDYK